MKKIIILLLLSVSFWSYSQEIHPDIEEVEVIETNNHDESIQVPFSVIENVPVYKGCDESLGNTELRRCMSRAISEHVAEKFNTKIINGLGLPDGNTRINVIFKIDTKGNITGIKSRAIHPKLEEEAIRVIKLIPKMKKPGYQKGKPVSVPYSLPIIFNVENKKDSK